MKNTTNSIATLKKINKLKHRMSNLKTAVKLLSYLSLSALGISLGSGVVGIGLEIKKNQETPENISQNLETSSKASKGVFLASTYAFIVCAGATLCLNNQVESTKLNIKKSSNLLENQLNEENQ